MRKLTFIFIGTILAALISFTGCSSNSATQANPTGSITTQEPTNIEQVSNKATLSVKFVFPETAELKNSIRPSTVSATISVPYASATLMVDSKVNQKKTAQVIDGSVQMTFTGVPDSGEAVLYLELVGCSINGIHNFSGATSLTSGNNVVELSPYIKPGSNMTSDGKVLVELDSECFDGRLTFNRKGEPLGFGTDNYLTNFITNQKYFLRTDVDWENQVSAEHIAIYEGKCYLGGGSTLTEVDLNTGATINGYGDRDDIRKVNDGESLSEARFKSIRDIQVIGSKMYLHIDYQQVAVLENGKFSAKTYAVGSDGLSVLSNGEILLRYARVDGNRFISKDDGTLTPKNIGFPYDLGQGATISYGGGYLIGGRDAVYYLKDGQYSVWVGNDSLVQPRVGEHSSFEIHKNQNGVIYVCAADSHKIWEVR